MLKSGYFNLIIGEYVEKFLLTTELFVVSWAETVILIRIMVIIKNFFKIVCLN